MEAHLVKSFILEIFLSLSLLSSLLFNSFVATSSRFNFPVLDKEVYFQTLFILFMGILICLGSDFGYSYSHTAVLLINDLLATNSKLVILIALFCSLVIGQTYVLKAKINLFEFFSLALLAILSLCFLLSSGDLISLYIALEMQSLCFYILAAFNRYSAFSTEAGLKYFVLGAFISGIFLFGASLLYGLTGTTNLSYYSILFSEFLGEGFNLPLLWIGIFFILVTLLFKLAAAPFHVWSPDVYEGAPLNSTILFVLVPKFVLFVVFFRLFYYSFFSFFAYLQPILLACAVLSVLLASILALKQKRLKRLMIYSSISHVGFMLLGCSTGSLIGLTSVVYYLIFYIITNIIIWGIITILYANSTKPVYLSDLSGLVQTNPALALTLALSLFSLAGIPPLAGFSMKFFIFLSALSSNLIEVSVLIILLSAIGAFYYLRVVKIIYFEKSKPLDFITIENNDLAYLLISLAFFFILFGFFNPNLWLLFSYKTVLGFFYIY
jgi:NADH-quinone oxidoreductase subunit N